MLIIIKILLLINLINLVIDISFIGVIYIFFYKICM